MAFVQNYHTCNSTQPVTITKTTCDQQKYHSDKDTICARRPVGRRRIVITALAHYAAAMLCCSIMVILPCPSQAFLSATAPKIIKPQQASNNQHKNTITGNHLLLREMVMNNSGENDLKVNGAEGIVLKSAFLNDRASLLESAFDAMNDKDKYDAVLTGLCSKILDGQGGSSSNVINDIASDATLNPSQLAMKRMNDPIVLLEEMNGRKVRASNRSLMALIDATTTTNDPRTIAKILSLALKNGSISYYGTLQSSITTLPPTPNSKIPRSSMTRQERLDKLADVPVDERAKEISVALATMGICGGSFILQGVGNGLGLDELAFYTSFLSYGIVGILIIDNFFDAIQAVSSFVVKMNSERLPDAIKNANGPDKEKMPLELGSGKVTGTVVRGLTRLWSVDTERECQCEAAAFFVAYSLGLPSFSFRSNALEAAVLIFESEEEAGGKYGLDPLLSDTGIMKMLIWLMAPVAIESSFHPQLIASDPREARGFLERLKEKASIFGAEDVIETILQTGDDQEIEDLLKWSYAEADLLLRENKAVVTELTERLISGASTVGDCVSVMEEW